MKLNVFFCLFLMSFLLKPQAYFFSESRFHKRDFDSEPPVTIGPPPSVASGEVPGGGGMGMPQEMPMSMMQQGKFKLEYKKADEDCRAFSAGN